jgi:hypothetical protein
VEKPMTLYRELTTTLTIEKPLINYKVTTFTKISTSVESVTITKIKTAEDDEDFVKTKEFNKKPTSEFNKKTTSEYETEAKTPAVPPKTVTIFTNNPQYDKPSMSETIRFTTNMNDNVVSDPALVKTVTRENVASVPAYIKTVTVTKDAISSSDPALVKTVTRENVASVPAYIKTVTVTKDAISSSDPALVKTVTVSNDDENKSSDRVLVKTVTVSNNENTSNPSTIIKTVFKTVTNEQPTVDLPISIMTLTTSIISISSIPAVSIISQAVTVTKTIRENLDHPSPSVSIETVTVTERTYLDPAEAEVTTTKKQKEPSEKIPSMTIDKTLDCEDDMTIPKKIKKKGETKNRSQEITKATNKGCEVTTDSNKHRTICRFVNMAKKNVQTSSRKKRTVVKTVWADESEDCENTITKTVFS